MPNEPCPSCGISRGLIADERFRGYVAITCNNGSGCAKNDAPEILGRKPDTIIFDEASEMPDKLWDFAAHQKIDVENALFADSEAPAVGDVNSEAKGSGARYNNGKPPMEYIPVWIIANAFLHRPDEPKALESWAVLNALGKWQRDRLEMSAVLARFHDGAMEEAAQVFYQVTTRPVKPYPMWNWAKGMAWSVPTACAVRHLLAIQRGEENDPETGLPHRGHAMCNIIMLAHYESFYPEGDDRPDFLRATR